MLDQNTPDTRDPLSDWLNALLQVKYILKGKSPQGLVEVSLSSDLYVLFEAKEATTIKMRYQRKRATNPPHTAPSSGFTPNQIPEAKRTPKRLAII